jgi:hypothetical protein
MRVRLPSPRGVGVEICLPRVPQVSGDLDFSCIYVTDIDEVERAHAGSFRAVFDPPL